MMRLAREFSKSPKVCFLDFARLHIHILGFWALGPGATRQSAVSPLVARVPVRSEGRSREWSGDRRVPSRDFVYSVYGTQCARAVHRGQGPHFHLY